MTVGGRLAGRPTDSNRSQLSWTKRSGLQAFGQTSRPGLTRETERKRELKRERERERGQHDPHAVKLMARTEV